jgi:hypothetical protein
VEKSDVLKLEKFTKELSILHWALVGGLFSIIVLFLVFIFQEYVFKFSQSVDIYLYVCPILAIGGIYIGRYMYEKRIAEAKELTTLDEKLAGFRAAYVMRASLIEGPALISLVLGMNSENLAYILISAILLGYLFLQSVTKDRIVEELGLK